MPADRPGIAGHLPSEHVETGIGCPPAPGRDPFAKCCFARFQPDAAEGDAEPLRQRFQRRALPLIEEDRLDQRWRTCRENDLRAHAHGLVDMARHLRRIGLRPQPGLRRDAVERLAQPVALQNPRPRRGAKAGCERFRDGALAGPAEAADGDHPRRDGFEQPESEGEVILRRLFQPGRAPSLGDLRAGHEGANRRAQGHEEGQQHETVFVAGTIEIAVDDMVGLPHEPAMPQIHQQEGEIVECVDLGEIGVEFDTVEDLRMAVEQADIAQMQIPVAAPDASAPGARIEQRRMLRAGRIQSLSERGDSLLGKHPEFGEAARVHRDHGTDAVCTVPGRVWLRLIVKPGDFVGQRVEQGQVELTGLGEPVEQGVLVETRHGHHCIDEFARAVEGEFAVALAGDASGLAIDPGRRATVQRDFRFAGFEPQLRGGEIEIGRLDRTLELEGLVSGEQDGRNMGFANFRLRAVPCGQQHFEKGAHRVLIAHDHPHLPLSRFTLGLSSGSSPRNAASVSSAWA